MTHTISTHNFVQAALPHILDHAAKLAKANKEATTGRLADIGESLGYKTGRDVALRAKSDLFSAIRNANVLVSSRLNATQNALTALQKSAQSFLASLVSAPSGDMTAIKEQAKAMLASLTATLNTNFGGDYIFGGENSSVQPVEPYFPQSAAKTGVGTAFAAAFGPGVKDTPAQNAIARDDLDAFLAGNFDALFSPANWVSSSTRPSWSKASSSVAVNTIAPGIQVAAGASANDPAFSQLARAYVAIADLGVEYLNPAATQALISYATNAVNAGLGGITDLQSQLGVTQSLVEGANASIDLQLNLIADDIGALEHVDPAEASTRISNLTTQLEVGYSLTARLQRLSLLNYLS